MSETTSENLIDTTVYFNVSQDTYHTSEDCAGSNLVIESKLGGCMYGSETACQRCNANKMRKAYDNNQ